MTKNKCKHSFDYFTSLHKPAVKQYFFIQRGRMGELYQTPYLVG